MRSSPGRFMKQYLSVLLVVLSGVVLAIVPRWVVVKVDEQQRKALAATAANRQVVVGHGVVVMIAGLCGQRYADG